ncbi:hypothetical protein GWK36_08960 [Caldichromatium japonicum]|uniref:Uncharacterized protein n=1 Tax=Caldichromatium japonicum TaxID=2699430 RepID=A0A6G7VDE4_9GAMM|nr:hypothetical protein [Caldichromatium japonicum]QIK38093.1 hypothetical protein GWK36_08960 [Caldichromatium japonicum]
MQILGSQVSLIHAAVSESAWERGQAVSLPPVVYTDTKALLERPVGGIEQVETSRDRRPYSSPVRILNGGGAAQRALNAYESVQRLEKRDDLVAFAGIDVYA